LWTPDGERVVFRSARGQFAFNLYWQKADGAGVATAVTQSRDALTPTTWHPDGEQLAYVDNNPATNYDVMLMALSQKNGTPGPSTPILNSPAQEFSASFSPDGRWLAYVSNESGRPAVYVRSYPGPGGQWMIAPEGSDPVWSRAKKELLYLSADQRLMAVSYAIEGNSFRPEPPRPWGDARAAVRSRGFVGFDGRAFDLHPDGERVIGAWRPTAEPVPMQDTVILAFNLFDELQRLTASGAR